jgi:hypothetical protein
MNVPNITQGIGGVSTLPAQTSGSAAADSRTPVVRNPEPPNSFSFTRLAWFDANGDGHIDPRSAGAGGDATLLVGSHEARLPMYSRTVHQGAATREKDGASPKSKSAPEPEPTTAQTRQAIDAYQRYGQAPEPAAAPTPAAPAPASAPAVTPVLTFAVAAPAAVASASTAAVAPARAVA